MKVRYSITPQKLLFGVSFFTTLFLHYQEVPFVYKRKIALLRFARNSNIPYIIKGMDSVMARVFSEAISRFHRRELVVATLR